MFDLTLNDIDLSSIGCELLRDTRLNLLPRRRRRTLVISGEHGTKFIGPGKKEPIIFELEILIEGEDEDTFLENKQSLISLLDHGDGPLRMSLSNRPGKIYYVAYAGQTSLREWITDAIVTVPMKISTPYSFGEETKELIGNGNAVNRGLDTVLNLEIIGPASSPVIQIGGITALTYEGEIELGQSLKIDGTEVTLEELNALPDISGTLPLILPSGTTSLSCPDGSPHWSWLEKWDY
jgi:phage-related protein